MIKKIPEDTKYFHYYNANPKDKITKDCVYRALSLFLNKSWDDVAKLDMEYFLENGKFLCDSEIKGGIPYYNTEDFLENSELCELAYSFNDNDDIHTLKEFMDLKADVNETYICPLSGHITVIKENKVWDTWDCSETGINTIYQLK